MSVMDWSVYSRENREKARHFKQECTAKVSLHKFGLLQEKYQSASKNTLNNSNMLRH